MADYNLKTITADTDGPSADTELLFGAPDQSSGTPKPYSFAGVKTWIETWGGASYGGPRNRFYAFTDCIIIPGFTGAADGPFILNFSGAAAAITGIAVGSLNAVGIYSLDMGTTNTGRASVHTNTSSGAGQIKLGSGRARFASKAAIHTLSSGTETYTTRIGFLDSATGESNDGVFFRYTDGVNSGKWQIVCRSNGTETASDAGMTVVADAWKLFEIDVNAAGTSAAFKIDGVATTNSPITTNIPAGSARELGYGVLAVKSAGTTATSGGYVDYVEVEYLFTAAR